MLTDKFPPPAAVAAASPGPSLGAFSFVRSHADMVVFLSGVETAIDGNAR